MCVHVRVSVCVHVMSNKVEPCPPRPPPVESHCGGPVVCAPGHAEWGVCLLLEQVAGLTDTRQTAVCDESCRVGGPGWGRDRARGQRGLVTGEGRDMEL